LIVLDALFLVKLVLEEGSGRARSLVRSWVRLGEILATVDLALPEALNALWEHARKIGDLSWDGVIEGVRDFIGIWSKLKVYSSVEVAEDAFKLALEEDITVYGALYIQLAKRLKAGLASFDDRMSRVAVKHGVAVYP